MEFRSLVNTIRFIFWHPLNRGRRASALGRFVSWQLGSRLVGGPVAVPYVNGARLLASPGMTGVTGNIYCGLAEWEDMGFALHLLREGDLMVDVGANVGAYAILGAAIGADVVAFEPVAPAADRLRENVLLNEFEDRVTLHRAAVGSARGHIAITTNLDTVNHVVKDGDPPSPYADVPVLTLDEKLSDLDVALLKIDVEGWETHVLRGARALLDSGRVRALIVETNGSGQRYGFGDAEVDRILGRSGYRAFGYDPLARRLLPSSPATGNTIYVRDEEWVRDRLVASPPWTLSNGAVI